MVFIDKKPNEEEGNNIVDGFLDQQWIDGKYLNIAYENFDHAPLAKVLLKNQKNYCCYCMRKIDLSTMTMEHIIPQNCSDFYKYLELPILKENVVSTDEFKATSKKRSTPPYPHAISYHNLAASCNGRFLGKEFFCCNPFRGNEYLNPPFYQESISDQVFYSTDGTILLHSDSALSEKMFEILGLNNEILRKIRRVWFLIRNNNFVDLADVDVSYERRLEILSGVLFTDEENIDEDITIINTFTNMNFWILFMKYEWFYHYPLIHELCQ